MIEVSLSLNHDILTTPVGLTCTLDLMFFRESDTSYFYKLPGALQELVSPFGRAPLAPAYSQEEALFADVAFGCGSCTKRPLSG